jgi:hypothetical protein
VFYRQIHRVVPLSSSFRYWLLYVGQMLFAFFVAVGGSATVIGGIAERIGRGEPWLIVLITGCFFMAVFLGIAFCIIRFMRKFASWAEIDPQAARIKIRHQGRSSDEPVSDLVKVGYIRFGAMGYVEMTFRSGQIYRIVLDFFDELDVKRWGVKTWWEGKTACARL